MLVGQLFGENLGRRGGSRPSFGAGIVSPTSAQVVVGVRDWIWVDLGRSRGNCIWVYLGCSWILRSDSNCQRFLPSKKFFIIMSAASAWSKSVLDHKRADPSPHWEVDEEDLFATCQFAPAIPLYTSTAFAVHCSSFQTARIRNKGGTQRSRQM